MRATLLPELDRQHLRKNNPNTIPEARALCILPGRVTGSPCTEVAGHPVKGCADVGHTNLGKAEESPDKPEAVESSFGATVMAQLT